MREAEIFLKGLSIAAGRTSRTMERMASVLDVPYRREFEGDGPRGPRVKTHDAEGRVTGSNPGHFLPGSADNSPDCYLDVDGALGRFDNDVLTGMYFHTPSLNLVLMGLSGAKVGVRMISMRGRLPDLVGGLRERRDCRVATTS